jgi:hypothetical protein
LLAGLTILVASLLLTGCPRGDHKADGMKDSPRKTRNY